MGKFLFCSDALSNLFQTSTVFNMDNFLLALYLIVATLLLSMIILWAIKVVRVNIAFKKDKILVQLYSTKAWYYVAIVLLTIALVGFVWQMARLNNIKELIIFSIIIVSFVFLLALMSTTKSGVCEKGVYIGNKFISWEKCSDFFIDRNKNLISFSNNMLRRGLSLIGTTFPKKFKEEDEEKLEEIMNEKKELFIKSIVVR